MRMEEGGSLVQVIRPFVFTNWLLSMLGSCPTTETGRGGIFLDDYISKDSSQVLKRDIPELWKIYVSKKQRKNLSYKLLL